MSSPALIFVAFAATISLSSNAEYTSCPCGWTNQHRSNVIGGSEVGEHEYPFLATVYRKLSWKKEPICGATIITPSRVITAAHCVQDNLYVLVGVTDLSKAGSSNFVAVIDKDMDGYDKTTNLNDIAILILSTPLDFTSRNIGPVCLPKLGLKENILPKTVRILGWAKAADKLDGKLEKVDSDVVNINDCSMEYPYINEEKQFCTYDKGKGPIKGDSGGPVLWWDPEIKAYTLVGIVSMGPEEESSIPTIHTYVPYNPYLQWIYYNSVGQTCNKI